jgi:hypothetical protein
MVETPPRKHCTNSCIHYIGPALLCRGPTSPSKRRARVKEVVKELRDHLPPASAGKDSYTLLKFYNISTLLVSSVLKVTVNLCCQLSMASLNTLLLSEQCYEVLVPLTRP